MGFLTIATFTLAFISISVLFSGAFKKIGITEGIMYAITLILCLIFLVAWTYGLMKKNK